MIDPKFQQLGNSAFAHGNPRAPEEIRPCKGIISHQCPPEVVALGGRFIFIPMICDLFAMVNLGGKKLR